jgi:hypothetical protein
MAINYKKFVSDSTRILTSILFLKLNSTKSIIGIKLKLEICKKNYFYAIQKDYDRISANNLFCIL